jgi:hypothetical protein
MKEKKLTAEDFNINVGVSSYNDLTDKPTIPTALSQLTVDDNNQRVSVVEKTKTQQIVIFTYTL